MALEYAFSDGNKNLTAALGVEFLRVNGVLGTGDHCELADKVLRFVRWSSSLGAATEDFVSLLRAHSTSARRAQRYE